MIAQAVRLSRQPMVLAGWLSAVTAVIIVRTLLENLSSPGQFGSLDVAIGTLIHYWLFYVGLGLALVLAVSWFSQLPWQQGIRLLPYGLPVIWLAPLLHLLLAGGAQPMAYVWVDRWGGLLTTALTFFGGSATNGIALGIRLELLVVLAFVFMFIRRLRQAWRPAVVGVLAAYLISLAWFALPSWIYLWATSGWPELPGATNYWRLLSGSSLSAYALNDPTLNLAPDAGLAVFFNAMAGRVHWLLVLGVSLLWYGLAHWAEFAVVLRNSRWERVGHYLLLCGLGLGFASFEMNRWPGSWYDWLGVALTLLAFYLAWQFVVCTNDVVDAKLDAVANPKRPIPSGQISVRRMVSISGTLLLFSVTAGYLAGPSVLFAVLAFTAAYWVYSMPPLRLKRWPGLNPFLVALACLSAVGAGFFVVAPGQPWASLPGPVVALVLVGFTLAANVKDVKDIAGDRQEGIKTLPVLLGDRRGVLLVAGLVGLSIWLVPLILGRPILTLTAVPAGLAVFWAVSRRPYQEKWVFMIYFAFVAASVALWLVG